MRRFRLRPRPDKVVNDVRRKRVVWTRGLYLVILSGLVVWLLDFLFGSYFYLRSEGMVMAPQATVATEFPATVRSIWVRQGDRVTKGQPLANITSQQVTESVARMTGELARLRAQESDLRVQAEKNAAVVRLAAYRGDVASDIRRRYEKLEKQGFLPSDKRLAAIDNEYRTQVDIETLKAELSVMEEQLKRLGPAIEQAETALRELQNLYGKGEIAAPIDGIVGRRNVDAGAVVTAGTPLLEIHGQGAYVLAYLPTGTFYDVKPGRNVTIEWGVRQVRGYIAGIEPLAVELPREFQTAFKPVARNQMMRIEFAERSPTYDAGGAPDQRPPLFTKVKIRGDSLFARILGKLF